MDIVEISGRDLELGYVGELFRRGTKAVILGDDLRVSKIWKGVLQPQNAEDVAEDVNGFCHNKPWNSSIFEIARNHQSNNLFLGDMLRFTPGVYAHFARKIKVFPAPEACRMDTNPKYFVNGREAALYSQEMLQTTWELMSDVLGSSLPRKYTEFNQWAASIEVLKYPESVNEMNKMLSLFKDASGGWTRLGQRVDSFKGTTAKVFRKKWLHDAFALSCLLPGLGKLSRGLNAILKNYGSDKIPDRTKIVGNDHVDGSRILTCLAGDRSVIRTQIYSGNGWLELPLSKDTLAIFPAEKFCKYFSVPGTRHRILMEEETNLHRYSKSNITLVLGIVDR